jgi:anaerobic selenocysteine-containing dehydrogenase
LRRRDFLKASALGAGVSLLEACGRGDEQFLVQVPLRPGLLQGESVWRTSVCQQCSAGCGIQVRVVDGNAKKIEGLPQHPVNQGGVCALGHSSLQELYNPDRILTPQRRVGSQAERRFDPLSWEDGLAAVIDAIAGTPVDGLAFVGGDRSGLVGGLLRHFAATLDAPAPTFVEAPELEVERRGARIALGVDDVPYFDVARSDYVLSLGAPFIDRWRSPVHYTRALAHMRRGRPGRRGRLVQAEARMSLSAANADEWLAVQPGTEGVLARALASVLLSSGAASAASERRYARLFPDDPPSVEEAAELCDVPADSIRRVAAELGAAERRVVIAGGSAAIHTNGLFNVVAALGLNVLLDNLGAEGGVFAPASLDLGRGIFPPASEETPMADLAARLRGESGRPVELLFVADADPLHNVPESWALAEALDRVGSVISLSAFLDDTTIHADLVLPLTTDLERFSAVEPTTSIGVQALGIAQPAVNPLGEGHHPADVLLALATALGGPVASAFPWPSYAGLVRTQIEAEVARLPGGAGTDAAAYYTDAMARGGIFEQGAPKLVPPGPTGRAPEAAPLALEGDEATFPLLLLPFESLKMGDGRGANRPWLQELPDPLSTVMWNSWAELSPPDAERLGVRDGDRVRLESPTGSVEALAVIDPAVRPGLVGMPLGQGYGEYGRYANGRGANPLDLVGRTRVEGTSAPAWAATRVRIERIAAGELIRFGRAHTSEEPAR